MATISGSEPWPYILWFLIFPFKNLSNRLFLYFKQKTRIKDTIFRNLVILNINILDEKLFHSFRKIFEFKTRQIWPLFEETKFPRKYGPYSKKPNFREIWPLFEETKFPRKYGLYSKKQNFQENMASLRRNQISEKFFKIL